MKGGIKAMWSSLKAVAKSNRPQILTGLGIGGGIATNILVAKATVKAVRAYDKAAVEKGEKLTVKETIKTCGKYYIAPIGTGVAASASVIAGQADSLRRTAVFAAAADASASAFNELQKSVKEVVGEEKMAEIDKKVGENEAKKNYAISEVVLASTGDTLFQDSLSGRYFKSSIDKVKKAINELNADINTSMYVTKNELYYKLGLSRVIDGDDCGWYSLMDANMTPFIIDDDGGVCIRLSYGNYPVTNFREKANGFA